MENRWCCGQGRAPAFKPVKSHTDEPVKPELGSLPVAVNVPCHGLSAGAAQVPLNTPEPVASVGATPGATGPVSPACAKVAHAGSRSMSALPEVDYRCRFHGWVFLQLRQ